LYPKKRIDDLSNLTIRLSSFDLIERTEDLQSSSQDEMDLSLEDQFFVNQILKIEADQLQLYLNQNPFLLQDFIGKEKSNGDRFKSIMSSLPLQYVMALASSVDQIYRVSFIHELRTCPLNIEFQQKIEKFCTSFFIQIIHDYFS
jgi:hypothetical protein